MPSSVSVVGTALVLVACGGQPTEAGPGPLIAPVVSAVLAQSVVPALQLQAAVTIQAPAGATGYVTLRNPCPGQLEFRAAPDPTAPTAWEERRHHIPCKSFSVRVTVSADRPHLFWTHPIAASAILGDSLPSGQYWVWVRVPISELDTGVILLPIGSVNLE